MYFGNKIVLFFTFLLLLTHFGYAMDRKLILDAQTDKEAIMTAKAEAEKLLHRSADQLRLPRQKALHIEIERLEDYFLLVLMPVGSDAIENRLNQLFRPRFPRAFLVNQSDLQKPVIAPISSRTKQTSSPKRKVSTPKPLHRKKPNSRIVDGIENEWLAMIVLALLGLLLVLRSNYQIHKIRKLQKRLEEAQKRNDHYLHNTGTFG